MDINNLIQQKEQLALEKENQLVQLGTIIGKLSLLDELIGQIQGEAQASPDGLTLDQLKALTGAERIEIEPIEKAIS